MANFPGSTNALPGVVDLVETQSRGTSVPGGTRTAAIIGEGARVERLVAAAIGGGKDGFNPAYTSATTDTDGRHFKLSQFPIVSNRTTLFKNGIPLTGLESTFTSTSGVFSSLYDYRVDIASGHIELQVASLVDQGGKFYSANALNVGNGTINGLSLLDVNAPTETWTIRCASTRRDGYGNPMDGYGKFIAQGTISGILLDGYGNQVTWQSNGTVNNNTVLQFSISEGSVKFREGDKFIIKVAGGSLIKGDSLTATYIAEADLNDPEFFTDMDALAQKHGLASLDNRVTLGGQLAFANTPPGVWTCQAAPSIPRRVSYQVKDRATGGITVDDLTFPLPLSVVPDSNSTIHFFVTDATTGTESQILPNKFTFYDSTATASPVGFTSQASGHSFSYTVVLESSVTAEADDGVVTSIGPTSATLSSALVTFHSADVGRTLKILLGSTDHGTYTISAVTNGVATISNGVSSFTNASSIEFEVIDSTATSAQILFTKDLALSAGDSLRAAVIDLKDATFFDIGWEAALQSLEAIETDIIVPLPSQTISAIFSAARSHCETMSNILNRKERVLFIGAISGLTPDNVTGVEPAAVEDIGILEGIQGDDVSEILSGDTEDLTDYGVPNTYGNTFRVVYFYPDQIVVQIGGDRVKVDGFFIAAAAAGFLSAIPNVAIPLTNKVIGGFTILRDKLFRPIVQQNIAAAGITLLQPAIGGGKVVWGKTTTQSGAPEEEEISIVFIRDRIAKSMRTAFDGFIGAAEDPTFQGTLMARANSVLQSFISQGLITAFANLRVVRDSVDPRQWNITVAVQPTYPVNWIFIRIGIGLL